MLPDYSKELMLKERIAIIVENLLALQDHSLHVGYAFAISIGTDGMIHLSAFTPDRDSHQYSTIINPTELTTFEDIYAAIGNIHAQLQQLDIAI